MVYSYNLLRVFTDIIFIVVAYDADLNMNALDLTESAVASAINQLYSIRPRNRGLCVTTDSGISFECITSHLSSGEDDEQTVTGSKPRLASPVPSPREPSEEDPSVLFSDLDKLGPMGPTLPVGVSVGRNDSQKSTTSSGYLGSGDEIIQPDWI